MSEDASDTVSFSECPACGSRNLHVLHGFKQLPAILFPIEEESRFSVSQAPIELGSCEYCRHVFQQNISISFSKDLYKNYYYLYPFKDLESMNAPYRAPFEAAFDSMEPLAGRTLLEIGCDSVDQMRFFLDRGLKCSAINPTIGEAERASAEVNFIEGFYGSHVVDGKYDIIISRFNLEHVILLDEFLGRVRENLSPGGRVIVQVPNVENFLRQGILSIFAHEHPQYFCKMSLEALVVRSGFRMETLPDQNSPSLICVFSDGSSGYEPNIMLDSGRKVIEKLQNLVGSCRGRVFLYGAGLSATALLYSDYVEASLLRGIEIIDDNVGLRGKYMPQSDVKVVALSDVEFSEEDNVIIALAEQYHDRVIDRLRAVGCSCAVFAIDANGVSPVRKG